MIYYKQRSKGDCRIACMATMLQIPYNELVLHFRPEFRKIGVSNKETEEVFSRLGFTMLLYDQPEQKVTIKRKPSILSVDSLNYVGHTHSIFWNGFDVYDPSKFDVHEDLPKRIYRVIQLQQKTPWDHKILMHPRN